MNKKELINLLAAETDLPKTAVASVLDALNAKIVSEVQEGRELVLHGLGKFSVSERQGRTGRNPRTGEDVAIPARKVPKFTAAKAFKDSLAGPAEN